MSLQIIFFKSKKSSFSSIKNYILKSYTNQSSFQHYSWLLLDSAQFVPFVPRKSKKGSFLQKFLKYYSFSAYLWLLIGHIGRIPCKSITAYEQCAQRQPIQNHLAFSKKFFPWCCDSSHCGHITAHSGNSLNHSLLIKLLNSKWSICAILFILDDMTP